MKVLLIGNLAEDRQESMQRFTTLLQTGLQSRGHTATVLSPRLRLARFGPRYRYGGLPKYLGYFDKFVLFRRELRTHIRSARPDVVHITDHSNAVYGSAVVQVPAVATCHDLLQIRAARGEFSHQPVGRAGQRYQQWICSSLARLQEIACVSSATRTDALRLTGLTESQVALILNSLNYPYQVVDPTTARSRLDTLTLQQLEAGRLHRSPGGFLLQVGGGQWYKNREGLFALFAQLRPQLSPPPKLVMVGPPLTEELAALAKKLEIFDHVLVLSQVPNSDLEALYNLAEGLLFPSWEEGFGWPVAEAQACGCPVFASNRAPMTEVGGSSSVYFDPADPASAARTIAGAWSERATRRSLALEEARRWRPEVMLAAYETWYRKVAL